MREQEEEKKGRGAGPGSREMNGRSAEDWDWENLEGPAWAGRRAAGGKTTGGLGVDRDKGSRVASKG